VGAQGSVLETSKCGLPKDLCLLRVTKSLINAVLTHRFNRSCFPTPVAPPCAVGSDSAFALASRHPCSSGCGGHKQHGPRGADGEPPIPRMHRLPARLMVAMNWMSEPRCDSLSWRAAARTHASSTGRLCRNCQTSSPCGRILVAGGVRHRPVEGSSVVCHVRPGWYRDPEHADGLRWCDGSVWTEHRTPLPQRTTGISRTESRGIDDWVGC
jgi:hypothetical protein